MFEDVTPADLVARCRSGERWQLLDVRESWELDVARVEQTTQMPIINIPLAQIPGRYTELEPSLPVAVLCHSGGRSARAAAFLAQHGFPRVSNVTGGIDAWSNDVDPAIPRY
jgi:rhodanese-related sulfurtransferase